MAQGNSSERMNLREIINEFRRVADDLEAQQQRWGDDFLVASANRAEAEACKSALLLLDTSTAAICQYALTVSTVLVSLDTRVVRVKRARLSSETCPLIPMTVGDMDSVFPGWESAARSLPLYLITDIETGKVQPYPSPDGNYTLKIHAYRTPLNEMTSMTNSPEIKDRGDHRKLVNWMMYEAYMDHDSDRYDPVKSAQYRDMFDRDFGISTPQGAEWRHRHMGHSLLSGSFA